MNPPCLSVSPNPQTNIQYSTYAPTPFTFLLKRRYIILMDHLNKKKIEFYSPPMMGHAYPLAKITELVQVNFPDYQVTFITLVTAKRKIQKDFPGLKVIGLNPEWNEEKEKEMVSLPSHLIFVQIFSLFREYFAEKKDLPELIINDFFAVEAAAFAKQNKVKSIVNFPNSFNMRHGMSVVSMDRCHVIEGFLIHQQLSCIPDLAPFEAYVDSYRNWGRVIFHTFVGLDEATVKPTNFEFIGLMPNRTSQQLTPELNEWMDSWKVKGKEKFLYVALGSLLTFSVAFAKIMANMFIKLGYPTIWSLSTAQKITLDDPLIYHKEWLPQQAILRLPQVRGFMTHCGWGSITEAISTKTPLICMPISSDQPNNARTVAKKNIGIQIYDTKNVVVPKELDLDIDEEKTIEGIHELMNNDSYLRSIEKLARLSSLHSGADNLIRIVTETLEFGNEHLICHKYEEATIKTGQPLSKILKNEYLPIK